MRHASNYRPVYLAEIRQAAGGRQRFKAVKFVDLELPDGRTVRVEIVRRPANLGGTQALLVCPTCKRDALVLRIVEWGVGLGCSRCIRRAEKKPSSMVFGQDSDAVHSQMGEVQNDQNQI